MQTFTTCEGDRVCLLLKSLELALSGERGRDDDSEVVLRVGRWVIGNKFFPATGLADRDSRGQGISPSQFLYNWKPRAAAGSADACIIADTFELCGKSQHFIGRVMKNFKERKGSFGDATSIEGGRYRDNLGDPNSKRSGGRSAGTGIMFALRCDWCHDPPCPFSLRLSIEPAKKDNLVNKKFMDFCQLKPLNLLHNFRK
jgi:hypothetical protein